MHVFSSRAFNRHARARFAPRKPRHRVLRVALTAISLGLLAILLVFGLIVGAAMLAATMLFRAYRQRGKPLASGASAAKQGANVVEGEYRVLRRPVLNSGR